MGRRTHSLHPITVSTLRLGQIPMQLVEFSPPVFRAMFPSVAYQLGNVCLVLNDSCDNRACD